MPNPSITTTFSSHSTVVALIFGFVSVCHIGARGQDQVRLPHGTATLYEIDPDQPTERQTSNQRWRVMIRHHVAVSTIVQDNSREPRVPLLSTCCVKLAS